MSYIWTGNLFFNVRYLKLRFSFSDSRLLLCVCLSWQPLSVWSLPLREETEISNRAMLRASDSVPAPGYGGRNGRVRFCDSDSKPAAAKKIVRKEGAGWVAAPGLPEPGAGEPLPSIERSTQTSLQASCWAVSEFCMPGSEPGGGAGLPALPWGRSVYTEKAASQPSGAPVLVPAGGACWTISPWVWVVPLPVRMRMALGGSGRTEGGSSPRPFCLSVEKSETFSCASGFSLKGKPRCLQWQKSTCSARDPETCTRPPRGLCTDCPAASSGHDFIYQVFKLFCKWKWARTAGFTTCLLLSCFSLVFADHKCTDFSVCVYSAIGSEDAGFRE